MINQNPSPISQTNPHEAVALATVHVPIDEQGGPGFGNVMRSFNGAMGYTVAGAMGAMETPGVASKVVGAALIAKGIHEQYVANGQEAQPASIAGRMRERIHMLATSLVDNNTGKMNLVARLKRRTGEEILDFKDKEYRMHFNRMVGGMMVLAAGIQFTDQPGVANKIIGVTLGNVGLAENLWNGQKTFNRYQQLHETE